MLLVYRAGGEGVLAMELWWRCAALEALQAYVMSQLALCTQKDGIRIQKTVASLLQPTLDAIMASPVLQACVCLSCEVLVYRDHACVWRSCHLPI